jgi:hypothetical protein
VRHILITHLDFDHAGGLEDFPNATVHLTAREREVADQRKGGVFVGRRRYRPGQWNEVTSWKLYPFGGGEKWFGFDSVRDLAGFRPRSCSSRSPATPGAIVAWRSTPARGGCSTPATLISTAARSAASVIPARQACAATSG